MSNYQAIAMVTATLKKELTNLFAALDPPSNATVYTTRPGTANAGPGLHLYLYRVTQSAAFATADLPTRAFDGRLSEIPSVPLVLHYLLAFVGNDANFDGQLLMGPVAARLHALPVLTRASMAATIADPAYSDYIGDSDLHEAPELVKLTPTTLTLDELNQIWSMLPSGAFAPSLAYEASVVFVEPDIDSPAPALPVTARDVHVFADAAPVITKAEPVDESEPVERGTLMRISGHRFPTDGLRVELEGAALAPTDIDDVTPHRIDFVLPPSTLAGRRSLRVVHDLATTAAGTTLTASSNVVWIDVRARVVSATAATPPGPASVRIDAALDLRQSAEVILSSGATRVTQPAVPRAGDRALLDVVVTAVPPGTYIVRVRVDNVESIPDLAGTPTTLTVA